MEKESEMKTGLSLTSISLPAMAFAVAVLAWVLCLSSCSEDGEIKQVALDIDAIEYAAELYKLDHRAYPESIVKLKGKYLEQAPVDPWGNDYNFRFPGLRNRKGIDIWSAGPDEESGTGDDIVNWNE